jgi:hypothetical protein
MSPRSKGMHYGNLSTGAALKLLFLVPLLPGVHAQVRAQDHVLIGPEPSCEACNISFERILTFGKSEGSEYLDGGPLVFTKGPTAYYAVPRDFNYEIGVFDSQGNFLRSVGREGEGPGEYRIIFDILAGPADSLFVFDRSNNRVTVLDPSLTTARTFALPGRFLDHGACLLPDGSFLANLVAADPSGILPPVHHLDPEGKVLKRFGERVGNENWARAVSGPGAYRRFFPSTDQQFWMIEGTQFGLSRWHLLEGRSQEFVLEGWLESPDEAALFGLGVPPTTMMDVVEDTQGLVWFMIRVPDPNWEEAVKRIGPGLGRTPRIEVRDYQGYWDMLFGVIDPRTGELLASARTPTWYLHFLGPGKLYSLDLDEFDRAVVSIWEIHLKGWN